MNHLDLFTQMGIIKQIGLIGMILLSGCAQDQSPPLQPFNPNSQPSYTDMMPSSNSDPGSDQVGGSTTSPSPELDPTSPPIFPPVALELRPQLRRLTQSRYCHAIQDLLNLDQCSIILEETPYLHGFTPLAATELSVSPLEVEQYETNGQMLAYLAIDIHGIEGVFGGCIPTGSEDVCSRDFVERFGRLAWRRPLLEDEVNRALTLLDTLYRLFGVDEQTQVLSFWLGSFLQSPFFLYQVEQGEEGVANGTVSWRYTSYEWITRLSFWLWDGPPDETLLNMASSPNFFVPNSSSSGSGSMNLDPLAHAGEGQKQSIDYLINHPRFERGILRFFSEAFSLHRLDLVDKDPERFPSFSSALIPHIKAEFLALFKDLLFINPQDLRNMLDHPRLWLTPELAALYGLVWTPLDPTQPIHRQIGLTGEETQIDEITLFAYQVPPHHPRGGLLAMSSFLSLNAHRTVTSPTLRGKAIQAQLRCIDVPPPPPGVDTSFEEDEGGEQAVLARDKLTQHRQDPTCSGCHVLMDPMGLSLEHFDAVGGWRTTDHGLPIDASGEIGGQRFEGIWGLRALLKEDERVGACLVKRFYQYAQMRLEDPLEADLLNHFTQYFINEGYRFDRLIEYIALHPAFLTLTALSDLP